MKIAFVGKGGSGKSTMSALFIRYLTDVKGHPVLALDADLNMNLAGLLGVSFVEQKRLSRPDNAALLRRHLKGENPLVRDEYAFLPTTPPGPGSNLIRGASDPALDAYAETIPAASSCRLLTVGTYEAEGIGQSCYHTNLFVAENLLSHTALPDHEWLVVDMVAGTDAFSYSLHLQFDAIVLIAEPTPESAEVCALYKGLAEESGISGLIHLVANKVEDADDIGFIEKTTGLTPLGAIPSMPAYRKSRQKGAAVTKDMAADPAIAATMQAVETAAKTPALSQSERLRGLAALHKKLAAQYWVKSGYGDVSGQYDALKEAV